MMTTIVAGFVSAFLAVLGKLATQSFFEAVISRVLVFIARELSAMTTNQLDDGMAEDMAKRLGLEYKPKPKEAG